MGSFIRSFVYQGYKTVEVQSLRTYNNGATYGQVLKEYFSGKSKKQLFFESVFQLASFSTSSISSSSLLSSLKNEYSWTSSFSVILDSIESGITNYLRFFASIIIPVSFNQSSPTKTLSVIFVIEQRTQTVLLKNDNLIGCVMPIGRSCLPLATVNVKSGLSYFKFNLSTSFFEIMCAVESESSIAVTSVPST
ncbi:hypothetical protein BpHYR1_033846 [Brachionus plicatilis]|uniref:Uncharacterized protein n=1 Tax=Brachionus plicatilis TaxID=10195 RepID=A0A3M7S1G7_BRAPC|nr:hypothetical protein BpHYR1_033846 [Brachionus plicatilis]